MTSPSPEGRSNTGFSLVQILIAIGLAGGLALILAQLSKQQATMSLRGHSNQEELEFMSQVRTLLMKQENCQASFSGLSSFRKVSVDEVESDNGIDLSLKRVSATGDSSTMFSSYSPHNRFGKINIIDIKFFLPNGVGFNYPSGEFSDEGIIKVIYEKRTGLEGYSSRSFEVKVRALVNTNTSGESIVVNCGKESEFLKTEMADVTYDHVSDWENNWDEPVHYTCPGGRVLCGEVSYHWDKVEDRRHLFRCCSVKTDGGNLARSNCSWSGQVNELDGLVNYQCPNNTVMAGHFSYHHNKTEDRTYDFRCCELGSGNQRVRLRNCEMYPVGAWANNWDQPVNFTCPSGKVKVGENSIHNDHYEDRLYRFKCCSVEVDEYK